MKLNHLIIIGALCGALLLPSSASSWGVVGLAGGGGGDCASQSIEIAQNTINGNAVGLISSTQSYGNAFTTTGAIDLYSISIYVDSEEMEAGETGTLTIRVGTSSDMSSSYLAEATVVIANDTFVQGWYEAVLSSPLSLSATTQYFFGCTWSLGTTDEIYIERSSSDVYASNNAIYNITTGTFNLSGSSASFDMAFRINKCGE